MKKWFLIFALVLMSIAGYAQNKAVSQFTTSSTLANSDYFLLQTDSSGTYVWRKITYWKMLNLFQTRDDTLSGDNRFTGTNTFTGDNTLSGRNSFGNIHFNNSGNKVISVDTASGTGKNFDIYAGGGGVSWAGGDLTLHGGASNLGGNGGYITLKGGGISAGTYGNVGINNSSPASELDITGTATMTGFKLTAATTTGYVLTTDASGNGTWQASSGSGYTPDGITIIGNADSTLTADMFLDIRSFGADTASADNSTALQNAIDSARVRGKALYIPSGTFKFTTGLIDTVSGLTIYGESKTTSVLKYTGTGDALTIGTGTNFALGTYSTSIFNLTLKGQAGAHNGIMLQNGNEVNINNCIISFFDNGMAQGVDTWTNNFIKVDFMDNDSSGIKITGVFNLSNFTNCSWRRNGGDGIYITSAGRPLGITITASTFETNGDHGIQSDYALQYFTLEGGWFEANSGISIYGTDLYSATISNCNFSDIHAYDIFFNNVLGGTKIFGNTGILATTAFLGVTGGSILNSVIGPNKTYYAGGPAHHVYVYGTIYDQDVFNSTTIVMDGSHGAGYTTLTVRKKTGMGEVRLGSGDSTYTGTIEFYTPSETLTGYFGYTSSATIFPLTLSSGVTFWIYGGDGVHIDSSLIVGGKITSDKSIYVSPDSLTSHNLDASLGNEFTFKLTKNDTLFITNMAEGQNLTVKVVNDSTWTCLFHVDGGVTNLRWKGGAAPTITTGTFAQRKRDLIIFKRSGYEYLATPVQDFY